MAVPNETNRDGDTGQPPVPGAPPPAIWWASASTPGVLSPELARLMLEDLTRPGDLVVDIDDDAAFAAAAVDTGRRHHALGGSGRLTGIGHLTASADLVLLHWPQPTAVNPRWLLAVCRTLLRADTGVLVVAVVVPAAHRAAHLSALVGAADAADLHRVRHVAAAAATACIDVSGCPHHRGDVTPPDADTDAADTAGCGHTAERVGRLTPHTDLLIFAAATRHDA